MPLWFRRPARQSRTNTDLESNGNIAVCYRYGLTRLDSGLMNPAFQTVQGTSHDLQLCVIVCGEGGCAFCLQLAHSCLDGRFIHSHDIVMLVLEPQSIG